MPPKCDEPPGLPGIRNGVRPPAGAACQSLEGLGTHNPLLPTASTAVQAPMPLCKTAPMRF